MIRRFLLALLLILAVPAWAPALAQQAPVAERHEWPFAESDLPPDPAYRFGGPSFLSGGTGRARIVRHEGRILPRGGVSVRHTETLKTIFYLVIIVAGSIYIIEKVAEAFG
jgi:hypothetical protein